MAEEAAFVRKKNKQLTASLIILTVLASALLLTELPKKKVSKETINYQEKPLLVQWKRENIVTVTLINGQNEWSATRVEQTWDVALLGGKQYDTTRLNSLVMTLSGLNADQLVETDDPAEFGLAVPVRQVGIKLENGEEYSYALGNKTVSGNGFYLKDMSTGNIYIIPAYAAASLILDINDLRVNRLLTFNPAALESLSFKSAGLNYSLEKNKPSKIPGSDMFRWKLSGLYKNVQDVRTEEAETLTGSVMQYLVKTGYTEDNASSLRSYGLYAKDRAELTLKSTDGVKLTLYLGKTNGKGHTYALLKDSKDVFTINGNLLSKLYPDSFSLIDHFLHIPYIDDVKEITLISGPDRKILTLNPGYKLNHLTIDKDVAQKLYQKLISLQLEGETDKGKKWNSKETPLITIQYTYNGDKGDDILKFAEYDKDFYLVFRNNWGRFLVGKYQLENLLKAL